MILFVGFVVSVVVLVDIDEPAHAASANTLHVQVIGHQWWWEFKIPEYHVVTANSFHIPNNRSVEFDITSADVIHSFWIPFLNVQVDALRTSSQRRMGSIPTCSPRTLEPATSTAEPGDAWMQFKVFIDTPRNS